MEGEKRGPEDKNAREAAAHRAVDVDRLLPGENASTTYTEDCHHWLRVYNELLGLKSRVLESFEEVKAGVDAAARVEIEQTDMVIMRAEAERFQRRLDYWQGRLAKLEKAEAGGRG